MNGLFASRTPQGVDSDRWKFWMPVLAVLVCAVILSASGEAFGQARTSGFRPQDELWFVDTRSASCSTTAAQVLPQVSVERRGPAHTWQRAKLEELIASDPTLQTVVWVHGNRVSSSESRQRGWEFYYSLTRQADDRPVRVIIWTWPADQIRGPLQDVRYKAMLSVPAAYHLASFLRHLDPATPLGLVGFSYGSRVITGAMHLQAGGSLGNYKLTPSAEVAGPTPRAVLWASAINDDWLLPGHYHGLALQQLEHATFLNNSCDRALKRYRFVDRCTRPEALGYWGVASIQCLGQDKAKIEQQDVCCLVGRVHTDCTYFMNSSIMCRTWKGLTGPVASPVVAKGSQPTTKNATVAKK